MTRDDFEFRMQARYRRWAEEARQMAGRRWRCAECGEEYGPEWVVWYGEWCHIDCQTPLIEVTEVTDEEDHH